MAEDKVLPTIDMERCTSCGLCIERCPTSAVEMIETRPVIVRPQDCAYCGICEEMCPEEAIALVYEIVLPPPPNRSEMEQKNRRTE